jgi:nucleotide-binding universal stress UspA family protein
MMPTTGSSFAVLVPLDGSELAAGVLELATALARRTGGRLILFTVPHVYGMDVSWYAAGAPDAAALVPMDDLLDQARDDSERYLAETAQRLSAAGVPVETVVADDEPAAAIVQAANAHGARLIVMASHGRGGLSRWAFGSVADKVLHTAGQPVLLVRGGQALTPEPGRFLVPLDGSEAAEAVLPIVAELARALAAKVTLVHVTLELGVPMEQARLAVAEAAYQERVAGYLSDVVDRLAAQAVDAEAQILTDDDEAAALIDRAELPNVDLVAITTHGRGGLHRHAFGSVADRLLRHATKPVLLVRSAAPPGR